MIRTENLSRRFRRLEAVHDLNLEVPAGSVFALIGPNGAGKSTVINTVLNIIRPSAGRAVTLSVDSRKLGPAQFSRIGYVAETQQMPEWMTIEYLFRYLKPFYPNWSDAEAQALAAQYELPLGKRIRTFSRGMRMKAALASSLAYRPQLLVLDEPFGALDVLVREQLIESVLERTPEMTVFLASHDLAEIESFASHIAYLDEGHLRFVEEMEALTDRFRELEVTLSEPAAPPDRWPGEWLNPESSGVVMRFVDSHYNVERSEAEIRGLFAGVREVSARRMPLRSIFVALAKAARKG